MRYAKSMFYVDNAKDAAEFFGTAFGLQAQVYGEGYAEVAAGDTKLAFGTLEAAGNHLPGQPLEVADPARVTGVLSFVADDADDVDAAYQQAVSAGAESLVEPTDREWGQRAAFVRAPGGLVLEIGNFA
ncbi:VOC family protein [Arthrobacter sp. Y-9]|uniref:VOC family protein n=1 Tax=Arthrobacter sp. Y-9 TaxID=3039385 RepID=UPI00241D330A|nr:VOC family protein [Arthrobacter sp. Y-9]WFR83946.1 VOC family protein [Arthrobacter sp. Y-9]